MRFVRLGMECSRSYDFIRLSKLLDACCMRSFRLDVDSFDAASAFSSSCGCRLVSHLCILPRGAIKVTKSQLGSAHQRGLFHSLLLKRASSTHSKFSLTAHHFVIQYFVVSLAPQPRSVSTLPCRPIRACLQILFPNFPIRHILNIITQELLPRHLSCRCH